MSGAHKAAEEYDMDYDTISAADINTIQTRMMTDFDTLLRVSSQAVGARRHLIAIARRLKIDGDLDGMDIGTLAALIDMAVK
jgi:hypothetical protein